MAPAWRAYSSSSPRVWGGASGTSTAPARITGRSRGMSSRTMDARADLEVAGTPRATGGMPEEIAGTGHQSARKAAGPRAPQRRRRRGPSPPPSASAEAAGRLAAGGRLIRLGLDVAELGQALFDLGPFLQGGGLGRAVPFGPRVHRPVQPLPQAPHRLDP